MTKQIFFTPPLVLVSLFNALFCSHINCGPKVISALTLYTENCRYEHSPKSKIFVFEFQYLELLTNILCIVMHILNKIKWYEGLSQQQTQRKIIFLDRYMILMLITQHVDVDLLRYPSLTFYIYSKSFTQKGSTHCTDFSNIISLSLDTTSWISSLIFGRISSKYLHEFISSILMATSHDSG